MRYILSALVFLAFSSISFIIHAQNDWITFRSTEFKFRFIYPPTWNPTTPRGQNVRGSIIPAQGSPIANCNIVVRKIPELTGYSQSQINVDIEQNPFTAQDWVETLGDKAPDIKILKMQNVKVDNQPAHFARFQSSYETTQAKIYAEAMTFITFTPGLFWNLSCAGMGMSPQEAHQSYEYWNSSFDRIFSSFVFE